MESRTVKLSLDFPSVPIPQVPEDFPPPAINGPQVWHGPDLMAKPDEWTYPLSTEQITELRVAINRVETSGIDVVDICADYFLLPSWKPLIDRVRRDMFEGRGFAVLRGFPVADLSPLQRGIAYFGIGTYFGTAIPQNAAGHVLGHVYDIGVDSKKTTGRGYQSNMRLAFHSDSADIVGLLCVKKAKQGGLSHLVSSVALFNEIRTRRPDLLRELMGPLYRDRREEIPVGQGRFYIIPAFNHYQGRVFTTYVRSTVRKAQRFYDVPRISPKLTEAMDMLDMLAADPAFRLDMDFEPGDIQFVCNHFILHSRTGFENHDDPALRRHLLRLHLACADGPDLPPVYENLRGFNKDGRPAGMKLPGVKLKAPLVPIDGGPGDKAQRLRTT